MANFTFSHEDIELVKNSISKGHNSWKDDCLYQLKSRIKEHLKDRQAHVCCYCLRSFHGEFNFVIDIEHILPKHKFKEHMFTLDNLAASCKRCNMKMKGRRIDFIVDHENIKTSPFARENYLLIHPNSDCFEEHIDYTHSQIGRKISVFYHVKNNSPKGLYSYNFFRLDKLTINNFDEAQGLTVEDEDFFDGNPEDDDIEDDDEQPKSLNIEDAIELLAMINNQI